MCPPEPWAFFISKVVGLTDGILSKSSLDVDSHKKDKRRLQRCITFLFCYHPRIGIIYLLHSLHRIIHHTATSSPLSRFILFILQHPTCSRQKCSWSVGPAESREENQISILQSLNVYKYVPLLLPFMLIISTYSSVCGVHADLGLQILHSDLGQPSQTSDRGKNVKVPINSFVCKREQCSQSTMGTRTRWTTSHQQRQQGRSSNMSTFSNMSTGIIMQMYSNVLA